MCNCLTTDEISIFKEYGFERPSKSASYNVRSLLDGKKYTAVFATSDADKVIFQKGNKLHNSPYFSGCKQYLERGG